MGDFHEPEGQVAAVASRAGAQTRYAEILTRRATDEQVERPERGGPLQEVVGRDVSEIDRMRETCGKDRRGEFLDLGAPYPIELGSAKFGCADA